MSNQNQVTLTLSASQAQVFALALRYADEIVANRGCNEFDLDKLVPDLEERQALMKAYHTYNGDPEEYEADIEHGSQFRWGDSGAFLGFLHGTLLDAMKAAGVEDTSQEIA